MINIFNNRTLMAGLWSFLGYGINQVVRLATNLLMTRLLVPEAFGVMAIANTLIVGINMLSDIGHRQNIIQSHRGGDPVFLNTAWSLQIIRGFVIAFMTVLLSLLLQVLAECQWVSPSSVYADPILPKVLACLSISALISGFESTKVAENIRNLDLRKFVLLELCSQIIGALAILAWALIDRSIWALVSGAIFGSLSKVSLSHLVLNGSNNRWIIDTGASKEIFKFGKWVFGSSILTFVGKSGDTLILAALVSPTILGLYSIAFLIINAIQSAISRVITGAAYPALSEAIRQRPEELKKEYYRLRLILDCLVLILAGLLFSTANEIINLLYDSRYEGSGQMLMVLSVSLVAVNFQMADQVLLALGNSHLLFRLNLVRVISLFTMIPLGYYMFGNVGAVVGVSVSQFISVPFSLYYKHVNNILDIQREIGVLPMYLLGYLLGGLIH